MAVAHLGFDLHQTHSSRHPLVAGFHVPSREIRFMDLSGNVVKRIHVPEDRPYLDLSWQLDMACISVSHRGTQASLLNTGTGASTALPDDIPTEHKSVVYLGVSMFTLGHVPSTGEFKVLRIHWYQEDRIDNNNNNNNSRHYFYLYQTCDIMTLGNGDGGRWGVIAGLDGCLVTTLYDGQHCSMDLWFLVDVDSSTWNKRYSTRCTPHLGRSYFSTPYPLVVLEDKKVLVWDEYMP